MAGILDGIPILSDIVKIVNKAVPDKDKQAEIESALKESIMNGDIKLKELDIESDRVENSLIMKAFERLPIPLIFYAFVLIVLNNSILAPYVEFFSGKKLPILALDPTFADVVKVTVIALFGKKVGDKFFINK